MNADASQWQYLEADLDRLLSLDGAERARQLERIATDDPQRAVALHRWLADIEGSAGLLEPTTARARELPAAAPWRLLHPIGSGGMGEVWLGERADGAFERKVAIKFLRVDRTMFATRLLRERELLARLHHPGIAMLLDAGMTAGGEPYLVTEWIDGLRLDQWLHDARPDLATRVGVLRRIAEAVGYAHSHLIVHRDLKPANVMVDRDGLPHLLDFGIARLLDDPEHGTMTDDRALTPAFAAPEQLSGAAITTRSDIYSLGGLLYWLISARTPHDAGSLPLAELVARVCGEDPLAPGAAAAGAAAAGAADLDAVTLKALARDPAQRYASTDAMVADLACWQAGMAVAARLPTRLERARRFVWRHRVGSALVASTVLALLAGLSGTAWQAQRARNERDVALAESDRSELLLDSFARLFREADDDERLSASEWLDRAAALQDPVQGNDAATRWRILATLAGIEQDRGQQARAAAILDRLLGSDVASVGAAERIAARCRRGSAFTALGKLEQGLAELDEGIAAAESLAGAQRLVLVDCLASRSAAAARIGRTDASDLAAARRALLEIDRLSHTRDLRWRRAGALYSLAVLLDLGRHSAEAAEAYAQVGAIDVELGNLDSLDHAALLTAQAGALNASDQPLPADRLFAEGIALAERVGGRTPNLATDLVNHAMVKFRLDDYQASAALARRAVGMFAELDGANPIGQANAYFELGKSLTELQQHAEARSALETAAAKMAAIAGAQSRLAPITVWQARLALASGDREGAQQQTERALTEFRAAGRKSAMADALQVAARIAQAQGDGARAESLAREALAQLMPAMGVPTLALASAQLTLAQLLAGRPAALAERLSLAHNAAPLLERALGADNPRAAQARALATQ
jgi:hypothetical protein